MTCFGIDLGTHKVSLAVFAEGMDGLRLYDARTYDAGQGAPRDQILDELSRFVSDLAHTYHPDQVWLEDVIVGNNRKYSIQLAQVLGAVMVGLAPHRRIDGLDIRTVDNKAWKREMVGNGNADKDAVRSFIVADHPDYALVCGEDQDCYDACCIGLYGLRVTDRAQDLRLTPE